MTFEFSTSQVCGQETFSLKINLFLGNKKTVRRSRLFFMEPIS